MGMGGYDFTKGGQQDDEDEDDEVKRPMNSFLLWAKIMRRKYATENPNLHNAEVRISSLWGWTIFKHEFFEMH